MISSLQCPSSNVSSFVKHHYLSWYMPTFTIWHQMAVFVLFFKIGKQIVEWPVQSSCWEILRIHIYIKQSGMNILLQIKQIHYPLAVCVHNLRYILIRKNNFIIQEFWSYNVFSINLSFLFSEIWSLFSCIKATFLLCLFILKFYIIDLF